MKNYIKSIMAFLSLVIIAIVLAQVSAEAGAAGGITYAMAIAVYTKACVKNTGGNARVFFTEAANVSSVTVTAGEVAAVTMATGKTFHEVQAEIDTVIRTEAATGRRTNISYLHRVEMKFGKPQTALNTLSDSLTAASACGIIAIVQDGNGACWLVGYNATDTTNRALYVVQDDTNSGATPSDEEGNTVTIALETTSGFKDLPFDATLTAAIIGDTATYITYV
jgi:hypothetical protein